MIVENLGSVPVLGGPLDGATRPYSSQSKMCVSFISPLGARHEWYELRSWGRLSSGKAEYKDRWVYLGSGTLDGPEVQA